MRSRLPCVAALAAIAAVPTSFGQWQQGEPTKQEIAEAYRSKSGEHVFIIPGVRWETWSIKQIRGWSLKFKRLSEQRFEQPILESMDCQCLSTARMPFVRLGEPILFPATIPAHSLTPLSVRNCATGPVFGTSASLRFEPIPA